MTVGSDHRAAPRPRVGGASSPRGDVVEVDDLDTVRSVLLDAGRFSSELARRRRASAALARLPLGRAHAAWMIHRDGPVHDELRRGFQHYLARRRPSAGEIAGMAEDQVRRLRSQGRPFHLVHELGSGLARQVLATTLGLPARGRLLPATEGMARAIDPRLPLPVALDIGRAVERAEGFADECAELLEVFRSVLARRGSVDAAGLDEMAAANVVFVILAGQETAAKAISNMLVALAGGQALDGPRLNRVFGSVRSVVRVDRTGGPFGACRWEPGTLLSLRLIDPGADAEAPTRPMPFGAGRHSCPGAQLALDEIRAVLAVLGDEVRSGAVSVEARGVSREGVLIGADATARWTNLPTGARP